MQKTGGTYLKAVLRAASQDRFLATGQLEALAGADRRAAFIIGSIRNPCDFYVALWSFGVDKRGALRNSMDRWSNLDDHGHRLTERVYTASSPNKDSEEDIRAFRKWIRILSRPGFPGIMSLRFGLTYLKALLGAKLIDYPALKSEWDMELLEEELQTFSLDEVDCWVRTESIDSDTHHCLAKWHNRTGLPVDWDAYQEARAAADTNGVAHGSCQAYFDQDTANLVRRLEGHVFRLFQYGTCCSSAPEDASGDESATGWLAQTAGPRNKTTEAEGRLLYKHMPKTGGMYLRDVFQAAAQAHFAVAHEFEALGDEGRRSAFTVGSIRNPCDYYVSLWAYGVEQRGTLRNFMYRASQADSYGHPLSEKLYASGSWTLDSEDDIRVFRRWIRAISKPGLPGIMSVRLAQGYVKGITRVDPERPPAMIADWELDLVEKGLAKFSPSEVDCWVRTESMDNDTHRCLTDWHNRTGLPVDWDAYQSAKETADRNSVSRGHCLAYFDQETANLILDLEWHIFRLFKYNTCCGPYWTIGGGGDGDRL